MKQKQKTRRVKALTDCYCSWWTMTGWSRGWIWCDRANLFLQISRPSSWIKNLYRKNWLATFFETQLGILKRNWTLIGFPHFRFHMSDLQQSSVQHTDHHGYQMSSMQSQNVISVHVLATYNTTSPSLCRVKIWMIVIQLQHKTWTASILMKLRILHCYESDIVHYILYITNQILQFTYTHTQVNYLFFPTL